MTPTKPQIEEAKAQLFNNAFTSAGYPDGFVTVKLCPKSYCVVRDLLQSALTPQIDESVVSILKQALEEISKHSDLNEWNLEFEPTRSALVAREALSKLRGGG